MLRAGAARLLTGNRKGLVVLGPKRLRRCLSSSASSTVDDPLLEENEALRREIAQLRRQLPLPEPVENQETSKFAGIGAAQYTSDPRFYYPHVDAPPPTMPCFRLLDDLGRVVNDEAASHVPDLSREFALALMATMLRLSEFDKIFLDAQRQGRISFYLTGRGEEGCTVGSAAALAANDWVLPQYRELGVCFWRGWTFEEVAHQLCANANDPAHGRQLPLHIGSPERHVLYVKSTLGTQCPQAAGVAYGMKLGRKQQLAVAYFGEGCASEGDIPSALNIAAVHGCPTLFFCRNNGYAISTATRDQYASDGIAPRGPAFGLPTIRVDGNDPLAVIVATRRAREIALGEGRPVLLEAMTYRVGAHSTSDDDTKYRNPLAPEEGWGSERAYWEARSPIIRFGRYLQSLGWYNVQMEEQIRKSARREAIASLNMASDQARPSVHTLFSDVYDELPSSLQEQQAELLAHMERYPEHYADVRR